MIDKIIETCARNRAITLILTAVAVAAGVWAMKNIPLDAIPDLSDTQVIIYSKWDRSPDIVEDQVTYPIVTALLGAPKVQAVRGFSDFGYSYVYVIFEDGTDLYWARSRTLEYLSKILPRLPEGVQTELGPDATSVGWVFQYALVDKSGKNDLAQLKTFQDWYLKYYLQSVPGVAEVATVGGFARQYQVNVDPNALLAYGVTLDEVTAAVRGGNNDVGGRLVEMGGAEYMVRGRGYAKSVEDLEKIVVKTDPKTGTPVTVAQVARVELGPDIRRGVADLDGEGDTVGGIVVMRYGENALQVIDRVKARLEEIEPTLPPGVELITTYDRSELILRAIDTLRSTLIEELIIVSIVILIFLWHIPSAIIPILTIPIAVILSFIPMKGMGLTANIMSLAGIAISIGVLVDGAIIEVENAYKRLQLWDAGGRVGDFHEVRLKALKEVGPSVFFSLLVIAVSFLPIFTLIDQEGRLFKPLAYSKTFAMAIAALLAITLDPAMRMLFTRMDYAHFKPRWLSRVFNAVTVGKYYPEERHPISKLLFRVYEPVCHLVLRHPKSTIVAACLLMATTIYPFMKLGSEFMPPLHEGSILYMPTTMPGLSVTQAMEQLQKQDEILKSFPEVERVFGKAGRVDSSTDPAPLSMVETTVLLKPESEWRKVDRWYSRLPGFLQEPLRHLWSDHVSHEDLVAEMDAKMQFAGWTNAWTMPIRNRIDMLSTGIRTPIGVKIMGPNLQEIEKIGTHLESILKEVPGTRSAFAERAAGGYFLDFDFDREALARYGLKIEDVNMAVAQALGGETVSTAIQGPERYSINVRYQREYRQDLPRLERVLVATPSGAQIPLSQVAKIQVRSGPAMIRNENGQKTGYVFVDMAGRDIGTYVKEAKAKVAATMGATPGYTLQWSGQYENMIRVKERLKLVLPLTFFVIFMLLYMNTKSAVKAGIVMLAVPFSAIGAIWLLWALDYHLSIAVWVGLIALMGLDAETGVFMLLFLDLAYHEKADRGAMRTKEDLVDAIIHGAVKRVRPKMMTVMAAFMGLIPIMYSTGTGADMMKRIAAPMVGGLFTSFALELLVYPAVYYLWKKRSLSAVP
ncbi:MAG: efflux RND transporter permease subunit [Deltaproteobacteria bacterium]|nr:efflux RND transporter permease subunit [Deltaproteobacteria bacterium]